MTDFRALCVELLAAVEHEYGDPPIDRLALSQRARAALAEPKPTFDEEWEQLKERLWDKWKTKGYQGEEFMYDSDFDQAMDEARAAMRPRRRGPMPEYHPAPFGDFTTELRDPWPVVERLRMALREAQRYCLGAENCTGHSIDSLLELLPDEDD